MTLEQEKLDTPYGPIWAHASSGDIMTFRVGFGERDSEAEAATLTINRKSYRFDFTVTTRDLPDSRSHTYYERYGADREWRVNDTGAEYRALRPTTWNGHVTDAAKSVAKLKIIPELVKWLDTERARDMLKASADDKRLSQLRGVTRTLTVLGEAVVILEGIRRKLERSEPLTDLEQTLTGGSGYVDNWLETGRFPR